MVYPKKALQLSLKADVHHVHVDSSRGVGIGVHPQSSVVSHPGDAFWCTNHNNNE